MNTRRAFGVILLAYLILALGACGPRGDPRKPIPTLFVPTSTTANRLVVVLPGRGDDLGDLKDSGIAEAIQQSWPDADVILTELTLSYYMADQAISRLHDEVIAPARKRGYQQIWLGGASLGGMGTILYDRAHPGYVDGLLLLAPYLGDDDIIKEIADAGGLAKWNAGPPEELGEKTWQRELWRHMQTLSTDPVRRCRVWLAYGEDDSLRKPIEMITPLLPANHVLMLPGGHAWNVWTPAMRELLQRATAEAENPATCSPSA